MKKLLKATLTAMVLSMVVTGVNAKVSHEPIFKSPTYQLMYKELPLDAVKGKGLKIVKGSPIDKFRKENPNLYK